MRFYFVAALLGIGMLVGLVPNAAAQTTTVVETFDTYTTGALPCRPDPTFAQPCTGDYFDYTHVSGAYQITGARDDGTGGKSFHKQSGTARFDPNTAICAEPIRFARSGPTTGGVFLVLESETGPGTGNSQYLISVSMSGTVGAAASAAILIDRYQNSGTSSGQSASGSMIFTNAYSTTEWYHFNIYCETGNGAGTITLVVDEGVEIGNAPVSANYVANTGTNFLEMTRMRWQSVESYIDNLEMVAPLNIPTIGASATTAVTGLVGFDVDPSGTLAIARESTSTEVKTYAAGTLTLGGTDPTNCNRLYGVAAAKTHVSYLQCDATTTTDVVSLSIRSGTLNSPDTPDVCTAAAFCIENLDDEELAGAQDDQYDVMTVQEYPFDYSRYEDDFADDDSVYMAWAVSQDNGRAGIMTYVMNNNGDDTSLLDTIVVDPSGNLPTQVCTIQDDDGQSWLYAASSNSNVKGARVDFDITQTGLLLLDTLDPTLTETFSGTASTAAPFGIACGNGKFGVLNNDKISLWQRGANTPYFTRTGLTGVEQRGIHMAADGLWMAYVAGGNWYVVSTQNQTTVAGTFGAGEIVAQGTLPSGTFREIRLQGHGSTLWVATSTTIAVYSELYEATTGEDTAFNPGDSGTGGSSTTTTTGGGGGGFTGGVLGLSGSTAIFASIGIIMAFSVVGYAFTTRRGRRGDGE